MLTYMFLHLFSSQFLFHFLSWSKFNNKALVSIRLYPTKLQYVLFKTWKNQIHNAETWSSKSPPHPGSAKSTPLLSYPCYKCSA